jgi:hypothetical protein
MSNACLICGGQETTILSVATTDLVEDAYMRVFGSVPHQVLAMKDSTLMHCDSCDAEWFQPVIAGSADFYAWIAEHELYPAYRWDFDFALQAIDQRSTIIDVGAGSGAFAVHARKLGHSVAVVESSPAAREILHSKGLNVFDNLEIAVESVGKPTVVVAFHVLEHVTNPRQFITSLRDASSDLVIVSVPNKGRIKFTYEPLDLPPHHLTRWSPLALKTLLETSGCHEIQLTSEPPARTDRILHKLRILETTSKTGDLTTRFLSSRWGKSQRSIPLGEKPPGLGLLAVARTGGLR